MASFQCVRHAGTGGSDSHASEPLTTPKAAARCNSSLAVVRVAYSVLLHFPQCHGKQNNRANHQNEKYATSALTIMRIPWKWRKGGGEVASILDLATEVSVALFYQHC
ncbi:hypothetical protein E2562_008539 [Oryza meyeriana var. granulata]|uniref:Uncharacterized protein n=1 Tax=Oryza meyeriana var. granulata TaxID=110450 RepID=A0A6G1C4N4_9ORYZ|nr:hypothetical protein E2562_008539 [Oryza meyeriana var. granulata]